MNNFTDSWDDREFPPAFLITIRTYGTWLHGDQRRSVDTHHGRNKRGTPKIGPSRSLENAMIHNAKHDLFLLNKSQRIVVDISIRETCKIRNFELLAVNVRTNHLHAVIPAASKPETIINDLKRYATRKLRQNYMVLKDDRVWSRGGSRRYLWKQRHVDKAIDYVLYGQGKLDFE